jgi:hypothetical protein
MAKSVRIGSTRDRMSSIVAGDRRRAVEDTVTANGSYTNVSAGMPVSRLKDYVGAQVVNPSKVGLEKPKNIPRSYVPSRIKQIFDPTPFATPVVAKKPPAKKPVVAKPAAVVSNVVREKLSPTKKMPPATRFGVVTGKTTGTRVSGGGGYGGGGTRGSGSLSGQGSGSRQAGTSRTGGTKQNNPVRG